MNTSLPVAIIGGGPIGLAAASHLAERGESFILFETSSHEGANISTWGHVRLFSPWRYNIDKASSRLLEKNGWMTPSLDKLPTGKELIEEYLRPLAAVPEITPYLHFHTEVLSISRKDIDKMKTANRENASFLLYTKQNGQFKTYEARAVLDASGTWGNPNPANTGGIWLDDEKAAKDHIFYGIPDSLNMAKERYINKRIAVVGGGHSAINALLDLAQLKEEYPETDILWIMRRQHVEEAYGGEKKDALEARGALGSRIHRLVDEDAVKVMTPYLIQLVKQDGDQVKIIGNQDGKEHTLSNIDEVIVNTGNRPNLNMIREIRTSIDSPTESVAALAPLIDPNLHSCGTVRPHGEKELRQLENDFYIVGSKSYGRAPTFLMATGYEQVRSIIARLTGDNAAAEKVELDLPETGVCSTSLPLTIKDSCC
ncbi:FAD-dependent oxidoreductase [Bacillus sp. 37MA]|uniref:FAD-dependent oxidoreductase n=1 Tax=Bacillus sp. 37MA TaxID=1132442 RepID=UPI0003673005|nr:FAD-dependent oxidoreductase [Bacillus sp. 37MA]